MRTMKDKYHHDAAFKALVDMMVYHIHQYKYTPSEMREAAMLACIIFEEHNLNVNPILLEVKTEEALRTIRRRIDMETPPYGSKV